MHPLVQIGVWSIPTYFIVISLDFCLLFIWLRYRSEKKGMDVRLALDVGILGSFVGLISARLFHVFYEYPEIYWQNPSLVFKLWEGGFVFLAGIIAGISFGVFWIRKKKLPILEWLDLFSPLIGLGYSIGRWACFFQGCCYGRETESIFGVHFHVNNALGDGSARFPTQIIASIGELLVVVGLLLFEKKNKVLPGQIFSIWLIGHGLNRIIMELLRDDPRGPLVFGFGISFWGAIILVVYGLIQLKTLSYRKV